MPPTASTSLDALQVVAHGPHNEVSPTHAMDHEMSVAALVNELFSRAKDARRNQMQAWKRNYHALNNRAYRPGKNAWDEEPAINEIWPPIASSVAWMTDQRPVTEISPVMPPFSPYADFYQALATDMNTAMASCFGNYNLKAEIGKVLWDVHTYGIGYYKNVWEGHLADGLGDAAFRRVDPFAIYPDPHAKNENEANYWFEARTMTVAEVERSWPGAIKKLNNQFVDTRMESAPHKLDNEVDEHQPRVAMGALTPGNSTLYGNTGGKNTSDMPVVSVIEAYIRGSVFDKVSDGVTKVADDWRCIVVAGNTVLMDESCDDVNAFGTQPYTRQVLMDTGEWYGPCLVEMLIPSQRIINWLLGALNKNIYLMGNPVLLEDPRSVSRNRRHTIRPGQRLEGTPQQISWLNPPQIHPQIVMPLISYYKSEIETITGLSAMVRGFAPTGRNAQGVLDSVQDAAFVRVRAALRELENSLNVVTHRMAATIAEFYTEPRMMSVIGPDGQKTHQSLRARHFYAINSEKPTERIPLRFTLIADTGSELLTSKQARASQAVELYKVGAIDEQEVLKAQQWPNWKIVSQRVEQRNNQLAAMGEDKKK